MKSPLTFREKLYAYPRVILWQVKIDLQYEWILFKTRKDPETIAVKAMRKTLTPKQRRNLNYFHFRQNPKALFEQSLNILIHRKSTKSERREELIKLYKDSLHWWRRIEPDVTDSV